MACFLSGKDASKAYTISLPSSSSYFILRYLSSALSSSSAVGGGGAYASSGGSKRVWFAEDTAPPAYEQVAVTIISGEYLPSSSCVMYKIQVLSFVPSFFRFDYHFPALHVRFYF